MQSVTVARYAIDWNDPGATTAIRVDTLAREKRDGCFYFNPETTVNAPAACSEFFRVVRNAQASWYRRFRTTIGAAELKRHRSTLAFWERQCKCDGVLVIHQRLIAPHDWHKFESAAKMPTKEPKR
jgi:hypothetical protein